jgi:hypothetical protein
MTNCTECANLCCIAPKISKPDEDQGRIPGELIKEINTACSNLCDSGCGIYANR